MRQGRRDRKRKARGELCRSVMHSLEERGTVNSTARTHCPLAKLQRVDAMDWHPTTSEYTFTT